MINCDSKINAIDPQRIREGRRARSLSIAELADIIDVSRQAISQFELGKNKPDPETLLKIASALRLPISFFNNSIERNVYSVSSLNYRANSGISVKNQDACNVFLAWTYDIYKFLDKSIIFPDIHVLDRNADYNLNQIELVAYELRKLWGLGFEPINNIVNVIQSNGILIGGLNLKKSSKRIEAFSQWINGVPIIVLGDCETTAARQRFTIAHELGHLILHAYSEDEDLDKATIARMEEEANRFASAFLMPEKSFVMDIYSTRLESFINIKKKWKVSIQAIIRRCKDLDIIEDYQYTYLCRKLSMQGWRTDEPYDKEWELEAPYLFKNAIDLLLDNKKYTTAEILNNLRLDKEDIERICFLPKGYLDIESKLIPLRLKN